MWEPLKVHTSTGESRPDSSLVLLTWIRSRRLGTRLNEFGVDAETIQTILRHGDVSTTQAYRTKTEAAMKRMDTVLKKYGIKA